LPDKTTAQIWGRIPVELKKKFQKRVKDLKMFQEGALEQAIELWCIDNDPADTEKVNKK